MSEKKKPLPQGTTFGDVVRRQIDQALDERLGDLMRSARDPHAGRTRSGALVGAAMLVKAACLMSIGYVYSTYREVAIRAAVQESIAGATSAFNGAVGRINDAVGRITVVEQRTTEQGEAIASLRRDQNTLLSETGSIIARVERLERRLDGVENRQEALAGAENRNTSWRQADEARTRADTATDHPGVPRVWDVYANNPSVCRPIVKTRELGNLQVPKNMTALACRDAMSDEYWTEACYPTWDASIRKVIYNGCVKIANSAPMS